MVWCPTGAAPPPRPRRPRACLTEDLHRISGFLAHCQDRKCPCNRVGAASHAVAPCRRGCSRACPQGGRHPRAPTGHLASGRPRDPRGVCGPPTAPRPTGPSCTKSPRHCWVAHLPVLAGRRFPVVLFERTTSWAAPPPATLRVPGRAVLAGTVRVITLWKAGMPDRPSSPPSPRNEDAPFRPTPPPPRLRRPPPSMQPPRPPSHREGGEPP